MAPVSVTHLKHVIEFTTFAKILTILLLITRILLKLKKSLLKLLFKLDLQIGYKQLLHLFFNIDSVGFQLVFESHIKFPLCTCLFLNVCKVDTHGFFNLDAAIGLMLAVPVVVSEPLIHSVKTNPAALMLASIKFC